MMQLIFLYAGSVWAVVALVLLFIAWRAARSSDFGRHGRIMAVLMLAAWAFVALYLLRYRYPGLVPHVPPEYIWWIALHGTVALLPLIGATLLVLARWRQKMHPERSSHFNRYHKVYGRVLIPLWVFTHIGGIVNAFLFY
ncbi:MAG: DUF420 domain-containing protein [Sedimenticola sp.]